MDVLLLVSKLSRLSDAWRSTGVLSFAGTIVLNPLGADE